MGWLGNDKVYLFNVVKAFQLCGNGCFGVRPNVYFTLLSVRLLMNFQQSDTENTHQPEVLPMIGHGKALKGRHFYSAVCHWKNFWILLHHSSAVCLSSQRFSTLKQFSSEQFSLLCRKVFQSHWIVSRNEWKICAILWTVWQNQGVVQCYTY